MEVFVERRVARIQSITADALWVASFIVVWGLLIILWNTWWAIVLVLLFALMLAGLGEFLHQTAHYNLFGRSRFWNDVLGSFGAAMVGIDLKTYRAFHLKHHRVVNTPDDPERAIYSFPEYADAVQGWTHFSSYKKLRIFYGIANRFGTGIVTVLHGNSRLVRVLRVTIPLSIAVFGFFEGLFFLIPVKVFVAWYLPLFLLVVLDLMLAQSRHYGTELRNTNERVSLSEQYEISWNLKLPMIIELMLLRRNLHAEHHEYPAIHWTNVRDKNVGRTLPLGIYLKLWWANGPKVM